MIGSFTSSLSKQQSFKNAQASMQVVSTPRRSPVFFDYSEQGLNWQVLYRIKQQQSPIDIPIQDKLEFEPKMSIALNYNDLKDVQLENIVWSVRLITDQDIGTIRIVDLDGKGPFTYKAHHLHFHGPSEHKFDGKQYDLEMHIVHQLIEGPDMDNYKEQFGVVGILFKLDKESHPFVKKLNIQSMGSIEKLNLIEAFDLTEKKVRSIDSDEEEKEENQHGFYHYKGSLTTPPCSDIVNWFVYRKVLPISESDLEQLRQQWHCKLGHHNYRECQPLYGRRVVKNFVL